MGLAPAAVVVRPDEDHRDVELAGLDVRDLEVGAGRGAGPGAVAVAAASSRSALAARAAGTEREHGCRQRTGTQPKRECGHGCLLLDGRPSGSDGVTSARYAARTGGGPSGSRPERSSRRIARGEPLGQADPARLPRHIGGAGAPVAGCRSAAFLYHRRDVRTDRAARRAARDQRPAPAARVGLHRGVRPGRLAPRDRRAGRRRPLHGAHHLQGHDRAIPSTRAISEAIEGVGGSFNAATDRESTVYWVRVPRRETERAMDVLGELIVRPTLDASRDRERARGHHRGDPLVPRRSVRVLPDPVPDRDVRRRSAGARDLRRRGSDIAGPAGRDDPRLLAQRLPPGQHGRGGRRRPRPRRGDGARHGRLRDRQWRRPRLRPRPSLPAGPRVRTGRRDTARPRSASACPPSIATIPTAGPSPSSTRSSATA